MVINLEQKMNKIINKLIWNLDRFGLSPQKLPLRIQRKNEYSKIIIISVPKSGTHFIERALCLHQELYRILLPTIHSGNIDYFGGLDKILQRVKTNQILLTHLWYSDNYYSSLIKNEFKIINIIRDPRDIVFSRINYIQKNKKHFAHTLFFKNRNSFSKLFEYSLRGSNPMGLLSVKEEFEKFLGWSNSNNILTIKFEDLYEESSRNDTLSNLYNYLNIPANNSWINWLSQNVVSVSSPTYRKGKKKIGQWKNIDQIELRNILKKELSDILIFASLKQHHEHPE